MTFFETSPCRTAHASAFRAVTDAPGDRPQSARIAATLFLFLAAGCSKPVEKAEEIRPVRVQVLSAAPVDVLAEFPGDVRARVESKLGFRVSGKIVSRKVNLGDVVKRGQVLMQLDPQDLRLAQAQANAGLAAARSNHELAQAELKRYQDLRDKNFVSQAVLDAKFSAFQAAKASFEQATAAYQGQSNQAAYATLVADAAGVVTGVDAEVGQVVASGATVVRLAQSGDKEVVIAIPEDRVASLRDVTDVRVRIWANPNSVMVGKLRELAPVADAATRTYTARIAIPEATPDVRLGMTAYVMFAAKSPNAMLKVPLSALWQENGVTAVWVVENGAVRLAPVQVAGPSGDGILLAGGVSAGLAIVTAGVNSLRPGQKVTVLGNDAIGAAQVAAPIAKLAAKPDITAPAVPAAASTPVVSSAGAAK